MEAANSGFLPVPVTNLDYSKRGLTWTVDGKEYSSPAPI